MPPTNGQRVTSQESGDQGAKPARADGNASKAPPRARRRDVHVRLFRESARHRAIERHKDEQRLVSALLVSLVLHFLAFLLVFDAPGLGLPGIVHPQKERRVQAPDLTVVIVSPTTVLLPV